MDLGRPISGELIVQNLKNVNQDEERVSTETTRLVDLVSSPTPCSIQDLLVDEIINHGLVERVNLFKLQPHSSSLFVTPGGAACRFDI